MKLQKVINRLQKLHPKEIDLSLDRINLLCVQFEVARAAGVAHRPYLRGVVVRARREQLARRVPPDRVHLVAMAAKVLQVLRLPELAHVNLLIGRARREAVLVAPVDV